MSLIGLPCTHSHLHNFNSSLFCCSVLNTPTTAIYTLSLHDALPISNHQDEVTTEEDKNQGEAGTDDSETNNQENGTQNGDRKSTRLNSSHVAISYAVFCLKKKNI